MVRVTSVNRRLQSSIGQLNLYKFLQGRGGDQEISTRTCQTIFSRSWEIFIFDGPERGPGYNPSSTHPFPYTLPKPRVPEREKCFKGYIKDCTTVEVFVDRS